jgi:hypothetical protein
MDRKLPRHIRDMVPDPRIWDKLKACGDGSPVHPNDVIEMLRCYFRSLAKEPLTRPHAAVIAHVLAMRMYPEKTVNAPGAELIPFWRESDLIEEWWWDERPDKDAQVVEEHGIGWLMQHVRNYDADADVVRGAAYVLDRLSELRPRPTTPFHNDDHYL